MQLGDDLLGQRLIRRNVALQVDRLRPPATADQVGGIRQRPVFGLRRRKAFTREQRQPQPVFTLKQRQVCVFDRFSQLSSKAAYPIRFREVNAVR